MSDPTNEPVAVAAAAHHSAEAELDRTSARGIGVALALLAIVLAVTAYMLHIYFVREAEAINYSQVLSLDYKPLMDLRAHTKEDLTTAGVVDADKGVYRVPIETGMAIFVREARQRAAAGIPQRITQLPAQPAAEGEEAEAAAAGTQADQKTTTSTAKEAPSK